MLLPQVDVREGLLRKTQRRYARYVASVEIDFSTCRSKPALELLIAGDRHAARYDQQKMRVALCDAAEIARRDCDGFVEAAVKLLLALKNSNTDSEVHFLQEALNVIDYDIFVTQERLTDERVERPDAIPQIRDRFLLRDLIEDNLRQFEFRDRTKSLATLKETADDFLAKSQWYEAKNIANAGRKNATKMFGHDHWWVAIFNVRMATALLRLKRPTKARQMLRGVEWIFEAWTPEGAIDDAFKPELVSLRAAQSELGSVTT